MNAFASIFGGLLEGVGSGIVAGHQGLERRAAAEKEEAWRKRRIELFESRENRASAQQKADNERRRERDAVADAQWEAGHELATARHNLAVDKFTEQGKGQTGKVEVTTGDGRTVSLTKGQISAITTYAQKHGISFERATQDLIEGLGNEGPRVLPEEQRARSADVEKFLEKNAWMRVQVFDDSGNPIPNKTKKIRDDALADYMSQVLGERGGRRPRASRREGQNDPRALDFTGVISQVSALKDAYRRYEMEPPAPDHLMSALKRDGLWTFDRSIRKQVNAFLTDQDVLQPMFPSVSNFEIDTEDVAQAAEEMRSLYEAAGRPVPDAEQIVANLQGLGFILPEDAASHVPEAKEPDSEPAPEAAPDTQAAQAPATDGQRREDAWRAAREGAGETPPAQGPAAGHPARNVLGGGVGGLEARAQGGVSPQPPGNLLGAAPAPEAKTKGAGVVPQVSMTRTELVGEQEAIIGAVGPQKAPAVRKAVDRARAEAQAGRETFTDLLVEQLRGLLDAQEIRAVLSAVEG